MGSLVSTMAYRHLLYGAPTKRKIFVSYHHALDQFYADWLRNGLSGELDVFADRSLPAALDSNDPEYINRVIREDHIKGSSVTVVLCGAETHKRKYVDWEIRSTLHHQHALVGIALPTAVRTANGITCPDRFTENWRTGYAHWEHWDHNAWAANPRLFINILETALEKAKNKSLIVNGREKMSRNAA